MGGVKGCELLREELTVRRPEVSEVWDVCGMKGWGRGWTGLTECGKMVEEWIRMRMMGGVCRVQGRTGGGSAWVGWSG